MRTQPHQVREIRIGALSDPVDRKLEIARLRAYPDRLLRPATQAGTIQRDHRYGQCRCFFLHGVADRFLRILDTGEGIVHLHQARLLKAGDRLDAESVSGALVPQLV